MRKLPTIFHVDLPKDPANHLIKLILRKNAVMQLNSPIDIEMVLILTSLFPLEGPRLHILSNVIFIEVRVSKFSGWKRCVKRNRCMEI